MALFACSNSKLVLGSGRPGRPEPAGPNETDATWQGELFAFTLPFGCRGWVRGSLTSNADLRWLMFTVCCIVDFCLLIHDLI